MLEEKATQEVMSMTCLLQSDASHCNKQVLFQCVAVCCSALQCVAVRWKRRRRNGYEHQLIHTVYASV